MSERPTVIHRYEILERLGQGGMGELYLASDPLLDRLVAIKLLRTGFDGPELRERFAREARSAARLTHPNIVTIYDVGSHDGQPFIAMEYVPGDTLLQQIRRRTDLTLATKLQYADELCAGLAHAHRAGIIHRDIKPANLIIAPPGTLKILDFGLARLADSSTTQSGLVMGTLNYMSPEQITGQPLDPRSDLFAVGSVLYELLSHQQAFPGGIDSGVFTRITAGTPTPIEELCPGLDPALVAVVNRAMAKAPADRFEDLTAMRAALAKVRERLVPAVLDAPAAAPDEPAPAVRVSGPPAPRRSGPATPPPIERERIRELMRDGSGALARGDLQAAKQVLAAIEILDPQADEARRIRVAIAHFEARPRAEAPAPTLLDPPPPTLIDPPPASSTPASAASIPSQRAARVYPESTVLDEPPAWPPTRVVDVPVPIAVASRSGTWVVPAALVAMLLVVAFLAFWAIGRSGDATARLDVPQPATPSDAAAPAQSQTDDRATKVPDEATKPADVSAPPTQAPRVAASPEPGAARIPSATSADARVSPPPTAPAPPPSAPFLLAAKPRDAGAVPAAPENVAQPSSAPPVPAESRIAELPRVETPVATPAPVPAAASPTRVAAAADTSPVDASTVPAPQAPLSPARPLVLASFRDGPEKITFAQRGSVAPPAKPESCDIKVYQDTEPPPPHVDLGVLNYHEERHRTRAGALTLEAVLPKLKASACKVGADAIVNVRVTDVKRLEFAMFNVRATAVRFAAQ